jgi:peptidyl-prolyl cis-trans isomerase SurA
MMKKVWLLFLTCLAGVVYSQAQNPEVADKIIATVDNYIVLKSELETQYFRMLSEGSIKDNPEAKCQLFEQLVIQKMMLAKAEIDSVIVEDKDISDNLDRRIQYLLSQVGGDPKKLEELYGKTLADIKRELQDAIREQMVIQKMEAKITEKVTITPREVKKFFESFGDSLPYFQAEVEVAHIVKVPALTKAQKNKTREKLEAIRQRVINGESFEELAKTYSEDPGSGKEGGDLGWQKRGSFVAPFEAAVFKMKPGELSGIVESEYGHHLIKLIERRGNEFHSKHILLRFDYSEVSLETAEHFLDSVRTLIVKDSIKFPKAAKEFSDDKFTKDNGGLIPGPDGTTRIAVDQLDSYIYFVVDTMQVGQISRPVPYRMDDGKNGLRLLKYISKIPPHQASLKDDYQKIHNYALNNKKNKAIMEWFAKTKDQVYINIDPEYKDCKILDMTAMGRE